MVRILLFILGVVAAALGLAWFADRPGSIKVEWLGYQIETNAFIGALAVIAIVVLALVLWALLRYLVTRPAALAAYTRERRKQQGLDALVARAARHRRRRPRAVAALCRNRQTQSCRMSL